jgi:hypothetical protein
MLRVLPVPVRKTGCYLVILAPSGTAQELRASPVRPSRPHITVAVFVAVTDTKLRPLRVQIDIWAIRTVNSCREHGTTYDKGQV